MDTGTGVDSTGSVVETMVVETVVDSGTPSADVVVVQSPQKWCVEVELDTDDTSVEKVAETSGEEVLVSSIVESDTLGLEVVTGVGDSLGDVVGTSEETVVDFVAVPAEVVGTQSTQWGWLADPVRNSGESSIHLDWEVDLEVEVVPISGIEVVRLGRTITGVVEEVVEMLVVVSAKDVVVVDSSASVDDEVEEEAKPVLTLVVEASVVQGLVAGIRGPPLWNQSPHTPP